MLIDDVEYTYLLLEENFETLYRHCLTKEQKKRLSDMRSSARYACWKAAKQVGPDGRAVDSSDSSVSHDLKKTNMQLATILQNLGDIGPFLIVAAEAVRLASALVPAPLDV
jgi:hypothetical protein